jgi:hypothetical protein
VGDDATQRLLLGAGKFRLIIKGVHQNLNRTNCPAAS